MIVVKTWSKLSEKWWWLWWCFWSMDVQGGEANMMCVSLWPHGGSVVSCLSTWSLPDTGCDSGIVAQVWCVCNVIIVWYFLLVWVRQQDTERSFFYTILIHPNVFFFLYVTLKNDKVMGEKASNIMYHRVCFFSNALELGMSLHQILLPIRSDIFLHGFNTCSPVFSRLN